MAYSAAEDLVAGTIMITGHGGDEIEAYQATPTAASPHGGVVVIHHMPGYDWATKEMTRRFAALGYDAICPNLYWREAPGADSDDASATARALGGVPDERLVGDVEGAAASLRELPFANGKVAAIGHCSGGRHAFLAALSLDLQAAVDCYGAFVVGTPPESSPVRVTPLIDRTAELGCPLLGLFGREDSYPSPVHVEALAKALRDNGKEHEFHTFDDAGHGFFAVDRPGYRQQAATQGWRIIADFFGRHLS